MNTGYPLFTLIKNFHKGGRPRVASPYVIFVVNAFKELVAGVIECRVGQDGVFTHGAGCAFLIA